MLDARDVDRRAAMVTGSPVHPHRGGCGKHRGTKNGIKREGRAALDRCLRLDQSRGLVGD
jgi:hypothetical protein